MKVLWFSPFPGLSDVYLNHNYKGGGWIRSLEKNIQDKVDLSVAFYYNETIEPFKIGNTNYFPIKRFKNGRLSKTKRRLVNGIEPLADVKLFLKVIENVKPDIIHIHGAENHFGLVQKYIDVPTVVSIQGTITVYRHKYFSTISYADVLKHSKIKSFLFLSTFVNVYKRFAKMARREQDIYHVTKHFIGRTAWDRRVTSVLAHSANYYHNDEILRDVFYQKKWTSKPINKLILFTTNGPDIYKGIETLLECANLLDTNNIKFEWKVAGLKKGAELVHIAAKSVGKPISANITFLGTLDVEALAEGLLNAHVYVATSHIENSPNSLCEAQILGLPCIATNAGGTSSLLQDEVDGVLIQDGDPFSMAGAIMELQNNYEKAILFGERSRKRALLRHDPQIITNDLLTIYKTVLENESAN